MTDRDVNDWQLRLNAALDGELDAMGSLEFERELRDDRDDDVRAERREEVAVERAEREQRRIDVLPEPNLARLLEVDERVVERPVEKREREVLDEVDGGEERSETVERAPRHRRELYTGSSKSMMGPTGTICVGFTCLWLS